MGLAERRGKDAPGMREWMIAGWAMNAHACGLRAWVASGGTRSVVEATQQALAVLEVTDGRRPGPTAGRRPGAAGAGAAQAAISCAPTTPKLVTATPCKNFRRVMLLRCMKVSPYY